MRQIYHRLRHTLVRRISHLVQKQGEGDGHHKTEHDLPEGDDHGIFQGLTELRIIKQRPEMLQADKPGTRKPQGGLIIHKRNHDAGHGDIGINEHQSDRQQKHQIKRTATPFFHTNLLYLLFQQKRLLTQPFSALRLIWLTDTTHSLLP